MYEYGPVGLATRVAIVHQSNIIKICFVIYVVIVP